MDYTIKIGGEAGQGLQTIGGILAKVFVKHGFFLFSHQEYMSRIRGGHNFYQLRFSDSPIMCSKAEVDILVALNLETIELHKAKLSRYGMVVYDSKVTKKRFHSEEFLDVPFKEIALREGGTPLMENTVATGAVLGMLGMDMRSYEETLKEVFKKKGDEIVSKNLSAAKAGYEYAVTNCLKCRFTVPRREPPSRMILINGNEAIGLGALFSGCRFYSAYPMTPSTGIMNYIASRAAEYGIVVEQAEDEISAINMALGASFAGVRAMTGSSGGGFALMVEGLSLGAITETPIVIAEVQRPGPATGLPTRTEQADLLFVLYTGHGEFPRVVFVPGTPEQAFYLTNKAFNLAEKYQIPAILLSDQYLADSQWTMMPFDTERLKYKDYRLRGKRLKNVDIYKRHLFTDNGVSPLAVPGDSEHLVVTDSDEHDEEGHMIEDAETRAKMVNKRIFKKLALIREEISPPTVYGDKTPETVLICWGSTYGVVKEVVDELSAEQSIAMMHFSEVYPFPDTAANDYLQILKKAKRTICIENNATGQFAYLLKAETGFIPSDKINRYDGRPFVLEELLEAVKSRTAQEVT
jgi:2-oxoglutarate ferredoxin oxidoreductase subunit alpha